MKAAMKTASRGVQFYHAVAIRYTETVNDMTLDEIHATWYCAAEYKQMHRLERLLARRLTSMEEEPNEEVFSNHGLESDKSKLHRRIRVAEGRSCVLMEQEQQWEDGERNPERIALISFALTRNSTKVAHKKGMKNAERVRRQTMAEIRKKPNHKIQFEPSAKHKKLRRTNPRSPLKGMVNKVFSPKPLVKSPCQASPFGWGITPIDPKFATMRGR
jgi:hypothetical protein